MTSTIPTIEPLKDDTRRRMVQSVLSLILQQREDDRQCSGNGDANQPTNFATFELHSIRREDGIKYEPHRVDVDVSNFMSLDDSSNEVLKITYTNLRIWKIQWDIAVKPDVVLNLGLFELNDTLGNIVADDIQSMIRPT